MSPTTWVSKAEALGMIDGLAHQIRLVGAMTTRNFDDILELLQKGCRLQAGPSEHASVVRRGLEKLAPLHRQKNSVADALLIELYASAFTEGDLSADCYAFVTSNHEDFSATVGDRRQPHPDIADLFDESSTYHLGVEGLAAVLNEEFGSAFDELVDTANLHQEPRRLDEILEAEQDFFDRVWYERHLLFQMEYEAGKHGRDRQENYQQAQENAERIRKWWPEARQAENDFEWGMWNGKLSALRWVLGLEWDILDT